MTPTFCSHCGHRTYQHGQDGCTHTEIQHLNGDPKDNRPENLDTLTCGCKLPHPLMVP